MPVDEGGGRGKAKPVFKRPPVKKKTTKATPVKAVKPDALIFGADTSVFVPPALVRQRPAVVGERDKVPVPFPISPPPGRVNEEAKKRLAKKEAQRAKDALVAPVDLSAAARVRRGETAVERKARTGTVPPPKKGLLSSLADTRGLIGGTERVLGGAKDLGLGLTRAAVEGLMEQAYDVQNRPGPLPKESVAALRGAKAGLAPAVYMTVGPDLMNSIVGLEYSNAGRAFDLAMLPMAAVAKPIKGARALGKAAAAGAKTGKLSKAAEVAADVYTGPTMRQARRASNAHKELVDAAVTQVAHSPAHKKALTGLVKAEQDVVQTRQALKLADEGDKREIEETLEKLKAARATARQEELYTRLLATADYKPLTPDDPRFAARDQLAKDLHTQLKGRSGALPPRSNAQKTRDNMTFLEEMADKGEAGRLWYENSARAILEMTQGDVAAAERFAQLLAIYSPQQPIIGNTSLAIRAWNEFHQGGEQILTGQTWQKKAATKVLRGEGDWEGRKTNNFYVNFLEDINKPKFDELVEAGEIRPDGVTVDLWMARVFGYPVDNVTEGRYDFVEPIVRLLADERGWKPKQMQAAIWTAIKDASTEPSANIDFAAGIARHYGQFNFEAAPGSTSTFGEIFQGWTPEMQEQFTEANAHLVDEFLREAGFLSEEARLGAGVWDGPNGIEFNPAASARVATSAAPSGGYTVHPTERAALQRAAAAIGRALEQDAVAWVRPMAAKSKGHADTVAIDVGRPLTRDEASALAASLGERAAVMTSNEGAVVRKIDDTIPNIARRKSDTGFDDLVRQAADTAFPGDTRVALKYHASDGDLVESGDYGNLLGDVGDGAGSGADLRFSAAADRLARDAAELRSRFATLGEPDGVGAAGAVAPEVRLSELETFLKPYLDSAYRLVRDADPSSTIGRDRRVRRAATDADRSKTHAIGVGDPVDLSDAPLIQPRHGPTVDRDRAERIIYEAAAQSDSPVARKIVAAFDEIEQINAAELARAEAEFMAATTPYETVKERGAQKWVDNLKDLAQAESAALGLLPIAGVDDPLQLGAASVAAVGALEGARRGVARSAARSLDSPYATRRLTSDGASVQLPRARSEISQAVTRVVDRASEKLDNTFVKDTPGLRIVTAHARVPKAGGRILRQDILRAPGQVRGALNTVSKVREGSLEDVAHFWYAQLPADYRNAEGLKLIREAQAEELNALTSGETLKKLEDTITALRIKSGEAETASEAMRYVNQIEDVKKALTDLEDRALDTAASVNMMDTLIAHAPPVNDEIVASLRTLAADRRKILEDAGRLKPERAADRESLVARTLAGLEPDGTEVYIGHRLPPDVDTPLRMASVSAGTGRVASPEGVGSANKLVLATTGRLRPSTHVALEDWASGQVFAQASAARDFLGGLGKKFNNRFEEGFTLINPKGRTVPAHWRTEELAAFSETADDIEETRELAQDLISTFASQNKADMQRIIDEAAEQGVHWSELRMVPNYQVERYFKQFRSFTGRSTPAVAYDMAVDTFATSIVFARVGYIPKNIVQNLIMALPHQGIMLPANAARAAQVLADPELRWLFQGEIGASGASKALGNERAKRGVTKWALGKVAHFMGSIADDPARMSAFLHEAAAEGVINRRHLLLTQKDRENLKRLLTDPKQRERLNDIRSRSVEAMADFSRLTPDQARMARRFLIIPGWLMAGSRYPFHFAGTHPIRSALIAYIAMGEPGAPENLQFNNRVDSYFTGEDFLMGIDTPWGRQRTASLNPVSTPWELGLGVKGSIQGRDGPFDIDTPTAFDVANPFASEIVDWAKGDGDWEGTLKHLLPGTYSLGKGLIKPEASSNYPQDDTRLGRLRREIYIGPIEVGDGDGKTSRSKKAPRKPGSSRSRKPGSGGGGLKKPGS